MRNPNRSIRICILQKQIQWKTSHDNGNLFFLLYYASYVIVSRRKVRNMWHVYERPLIRWTWQCSDRAKYGRRQKIYGEMEKWNGNHHLPTLQYSLQLISCSSVILKYNGSLLVLDNCIEFSSLAFAFCSLMLFLVIKWSKILSFIYSGKLWTKKMAITVSRILCRIHTPKPQCHLQRYRLP